MAYSRPSVYSYPRQFKSVEDAYEWAKRLYVELKENDTRAEELGHRVTDKDLKELIVRPEWHGAKGDGVTDDIKALYTITQNFYNKGITVELRPGAVYRASDIWMLHGNINVNGNGAVIYNTGTGTSSYQPLGVACNANSPIWTVEYSRGTAYGFNAGDKYDSSVTMTTPGEAANFEAGDYVNLYWGTDPTDPNEEYARDVNIVRSINATTGVVELEYPVMYDFSEVTPTPKIRKLNHPYTGTIQDLTVRSISGSDVGIYAVRNLFSTYRDIKFENIGEVCFSPIESRGLTADGLSFVKSVRTASTCDLCHAWGNVDLTLSGLKDHGMFHHPTVLLESQNRGVMIKDSTLIGRDQDTDTFPLQISGGSEDVVVKGCMFANIYQVCLVNQDSKAFIYNNRIYGLVQGQIAGMDPTDSTVIFRDNWIDGRWQGRHEVVRFYKCGVAANEAGGNMEHVMLNDAMPEMAVPYGYRIKMVGTIASGTLGPIYFKGSGNWIKIADSVTGDTTGYFQPGTNDEANLHADANGTFDVALYSTSLNPADSIDLYVDLLVEH